MMIGTVLFARSRLQTSSPSSRGSMMSRTTRSTGCASNFSSASSPSAAWTTSYPSRSSGNASTLRTESSSSTSRIVGEESGIGGGACRDARTPVRRFALPTIALHMTLTRTPAGRRRARRGSVERPVNGRLYRASFAVVLLPLLLLAFTTSRPGVLGAPTLPPSFDSVGAKALATEFATSYPDRAPGSAGALGAATWVRDQFRSFGLPIQTDSWQQRLPDGPVAKLENIWAVAPGQSKNAIVVMAHRDNSGIGPGANDNASGTAALVELARGYTAGNTPGAQRVYPAHTLVFLSTDAGLYGGLGAERFASHAPFHVAAVVNLTAIGGKERPRLVISGGAPRT